MLPVVVSQKTGLPTSTIRKMQKLYRDRTQQSGSEVVIEMREGVIA
jgi:hypothetical protein